MSGVWYAQGGEDQICARLFRRIGIRSHSAVEFGAVDGLFKSNTAHFRERGWRVWLFDQDPRMLTIDARTDRPHVHQADITADNINGLFVFHGVPADLDLLSIDIDGNDLWVWKALTYQPNIVIIEYNPRWRPIRRRTVPYDPTRQWDRTDYYGASAGALVHLGREKGYTLAASTEYNLIFVRAGLAPEIAVDQVRYRWKARQPDPLRRPWIGYP